MDYVALIAELQKQMQANTTEMETLLEMSVAEKRDLTEDEQKKFDSVSGRNDDLAKRVKNFEKLQAEQQRSPVAVTLVDPTKAIVEPVSDLPNGNTIEASEISIPARAFRQSPQLLSLQGSHAQERTYRFGMWAAAGLGYAPARKWCNDRGLKFEAVHEGTVNTTGGYLVPTQIDADIISLIDFYGLARQLARVTPMTSDTLNRPRRTGGLTATWEGESDAIAESTKSWDNVSMTAKKLAVLTRISNELNEDAIINVADDLIREIAIAFANKEDLAYFTGNGAITFGGILGFEGKFDAIGTTSGGGLQVATGNLMSEATMTDLVNWVARLPQLADGVNTRIVMHRLAYYNIIVRLISALGGNTVQTIEAVTRAQLWGYPVLFSNAMPSSDANSQVLALMGDFTLASMFGDRRARTISFSDSASLGTNDNVFAKDQIAIRGTERIDINVHDVGTSSVAGPVIALMSKAS